MTSDTASWTAPPQPPKKRNLWIATPVGIAIFGAVLASAYFSLELFTVVVYGFCIAAYPEWQRALQRQGRLISIVPIVAGTVGMGVSVHFGGREGLIIALLVAAAGSIGWRLVDVWVENTLHDALATILTLVWIPFMASFMVLMAQAEDGWIRVFIFVSAVVFNDTGALFVGMIAGRHKLAPRISPKKTWEGAVGGVLFGTGVAMALSWYLYDGNWRIGMLVGLATCVAAIFGDLAESALKRDIQIKDMSGIIPGHGGVLDRIDAALLAAPVAFLMFAAIRGSLG